jgi:hypothetical protein
MSISKKLKYDVTVEVDSPIEETASAIFLIKKLLRINKIKMKLSIAYDYTYEGCGVYYPNLRNQGYRIFINPMNCKTNDDIDKNNWKEPFCPGSNCDMTIFGVTLHEFSHVLEYKVFPNIIPNYGKEFPENRFYLNQYSNNTLEDELAEVLTLYITNPYLLKLISESHFKFCKKYFKSPVDCTKERCSSIYDGFPILVKKSIKEKWNIVYNVDIEDFVKVTNEK